jgi:hypothetical protein
MPGEQLTPRQQTPQARLSGVIAEKLQAVKPYSPTERTIVFKAIFDSERFFYEVTKCNGEKNGIEGSDTIIIATELETLLPSFFHLSGTTQEMMVNGHTVRTNEDRGKYEAMITDLETAEPFSLGDQNEAA